MVFQTGAMLHRGIVSVFSPHKMSLRLHYTSCRQTEFTASNAQFSSLNKSSTRSSIHNRRYNLSRRVVTRASLGDAAITLFEQFPAQDALAFLGSAIGSKLLIKVFEKLEHDEVIDKNLSRKLVHTLAGPLFILFWPCFSSSSYAQYIAALVPLINGLRLILIGTNTIPDTRMVSAMSRTGDPGELLRGPLYYVIILSIITGVYWRTSLVGIVVASLMCGGDGLADIVGRRLGSTNPLPWNSSKSWAGSAAMFFGGFGTALVLVSYFSYLGYIVVEWPSTIASVGAIACVSTIIESLPINQKVDDNLSVPGVAAVMGSMMLQLAVDVL